jgi:hypothetical protein
MNGICEGSMASDKSCVIVAATNEEQVIDQSMLLAAWTRAAESRGAFLHTRPGDERDSHWITRVLQQTRLATTLATRAVSHQSFVPKIARVPHPYATAPNTIPPTRRHERGTAFQ